MCIPIVSRAPQIFSPRSPLRADSNSWRSTTSKCSTPRTGSGRSTKSTRTQRFSVRSGRHSCGRRCSRRWRPRSRVAVPTAGGRVHGSAGGRRGRADGGRTGGDADSARAAGADKGWRNLIEPRRIWPLLGSAPGWLNWGMTIDVTTPIGQAALELVRASESITIANHSIRSWLFADRLAQHRGLRAGEDYDGDALFYATVLHDMGLSPSGLRRPDRFEVAGADVAAEFLDSHGVHGRHDRDRVGGDRASFLIWHRVTARARVSALPRGHHARLRGRL